MTQLLPYGSECWRSCEETGGDTPIVPTVNPVLGGEADPNDAYPDGPPYPLLWGEYNQTVAGGAVLTTWKWNPGAVPLRWV